MAVYKVTQRYASNGIGPFDKGQSVDLDEATAEFVERDSPGTLESTSEVKKVRLQGKRKDRAVLSGENRGADNAPVDADDPDVADPGPEGQGGDE